MDAEPGWILSLCRGQNADHALTSAFILDLTKSHITDIVDSQLDGRGQLRRFALRQISSAEPGYVALSLIFLSIVGESKDLQTVEGLTAHSSNLVRRAARVCEYDLKRADRK